jgi:NodT family efflux transporter outer membrane factor (OMF) lipoprotein
VTEGGIQWNQRSESGAFGTGQGIADVLRSILTAVFCLGLLPACSNLGGPEYQRPDAPSKADWSDDANAGVSAEAVIQPDWWTGFADPYLNELIGRAISDNVDIRILAARSGVAKAAIGQAKAGLLPTISGGAGTDTLKSSGSSSRTQYSVASDVIWEADIWGKVRKGVDAQQADYKATEAGWRAGYLVTVSDVATAYFQIRQFDEQIDQQQKTLERNRQIYGIYEQMYGEGLVPKTQVLQQQAELSRLQTGLLDLKRLRKLTENGLATLLGMPADSLRVPKAGLRSVQAVVVPAGLPSDLVSRRPDIIAAEYRVLQAYNLEGQARLERLPSLSLTGKAGSASFDLVDLLQSWTFGVSSLVSIPIFDPNIRARIEVSEAQTRVVEEEYRRTVLGAFEEVENALTSLAIRKAQTGELSSRRANLVTVSEQVYAQLEEGMVSQLEVFEVERTLLDAEQEMLANHWLVLSDTIALFKALGGGWPREVVASSFK